LVLEDAGRLAAPVAQVIELGPADLAALQHLDAVDVGAEHRKDALDALAIGDLADREALGNAGPGACDHDALVGLQALLVALANLHPDLDGVAVGEIGVLALGRQRVVLLLVELLDDVHVRSDLFAGGASGAPVLVTTEVLDRAAIVEVGGGVQRPAAPAGSEPAGEKADTAEGENAAGNPGRRLAVF